MEEREAEEDLPVELGLVGRLELLLGGRGEGRPQVGADTLWRLVGHLDAVLQHRHGELGGGHRCEPEAEGRVGLVRVDVLDLLLERAHPADVEVAVHEQHPPPAVLAVLDKLLSLGPLALAERDVVEPVGHARVLGVGDDAADGVGARGQDEDERQARVGVLEGRVQVGRRRLDETAAELRLDVELDARHDIVGTDRAQHAELLEPIELRLPHARQRVRLGRDRVVHRPPGVGLLVQVGQDALEDVELVQVDKLDPGRGGEPVELGLLQVAGGELAAGEQEAPLVEVDLARAHLDLDGEQERVHELVHLEDGAADVGVEQVGDEVVQVGDALAEVLALRRAADAVDEELLVPGERVLVHGVDRGEVGDAEEQDGAAHGHRDVL